MIIIEELDCPVHAKKSIINSTKEGGKKRANKTPTHLIVDSKITETNYEGEPAGLHGSKIVKGRSSQIVVDTQGNIWVAVHS